MPSARGKRSGVAEGIVPRPLRRAVLDRDRWECQLCHVRLTDHDATLPTHGVAGHVIAHVDGGSLSIDNLRAECQSCSQSGGARIGNRVRRERYAQRNAEAGAGAHTHAETHTESNTRSFFGAGPGPEKAATSPFIHPTSAGTGESAETVTTLANGPEVFADIPWLAKIVEEYPDASGSWPRFMSPPNPRAVGTYAGEVPISWPGRESLRWWQRLWLARVLEHDESGELVWLTWLATSPRQVGKSVGLRELCMWRITQAERIGEAQEITIVSNRIKSANVVQLAVRRWARRQEAHGWNARDANDGVEVYYGDSLWRLVAGSGVYSTSAGLAVVDEAWNVHARTVDDGITPTLLERRWPQLGITSTANPLTGPLFVDRRRNAVTGADPDTLLIEWSAPAAMPWDELGTWRAASPHWSANRERIITAAARAVDDDEVKLREFEAQYLNRWPWRVGELVGHVLAPGIRLIEAGIWETLAGDEPISGPLMFAIESMTGDTVAIACAGRTASGIQVEAYRIDDLAVALVWVKEHAVPGSVLVVGVTLRHDIVDTDLGMPVMPAATTENRAALASLRRLVRRRAVRHSSSPELAAQIDALRINEGSRSGINVVGSPETWDLARAAAWAITACDRDRSGTPPAVF